MRTIFFFCCCFLFTMLQAQTETATVRITLQNNAGVPHRAQPVTLTDTASHAAFTATTDAMGLAVLQVPPAGIYRMTTPLYTREKIIPAGNVPGRTINMTIRFDADMRQTEDAMRLPDAQRNELTLMVKNLPDTTFFKASNGYALKADGQWTLLEITLLGLEGEPLQNEVITFTGRSSHKSFKGATGMNGKLTVRLPKCDIYAVNFKYHPAYSTQDVGCTQSISEGEIQIQYIGTREIERRKKEEDLRVAEEKKRQEENRLLFEAQAKKQHQSAVEARKEEIRQYMNGQRVFDDDVILKTLERNTQWKSKLIVVDVTGSMDAYLAQVLVWAKKHEKDDPGRQFVFFNDADPGKFVGTTKNWLYINSSNIDTLIERTVIWHEGGNGGYIEENDVEALIMAQNIAKKPFTDVVLIADNNSPVYDMIFLNELVKLTHPIHVILCGARYGFVETDYLNIAKATNGSVHTVESDIGMQGYQKDNAVLELMGKQYRIIHGEFYEVK